MPPDDRKKRILDHLAKSTDGVKFGTAKTTSKSKPSTPSIERIISVELPPPPPIPQPVVPSPPFKGNRKKQVMNHVKLSSGDFGDFSLTSEKRKQKITQHLRNTQS